MAWANSPQGAFFDVGGTLFESRPGAPEVYATVLSRLGGPVSADEVAPVFRRVWSELTQLHPRGLDRYHTVKGNEREWWGEFVRRVLADLGHEAPWETALDQLMEAFGEPELWYVFPEVTEVLGRLRSWGVRLAVVSNWDSRLPALLERLGLSAYFDEVLVSAVEGVEKPDAAMFHRAAGRLGLEPGRCLHVGDSPLDDYRGAESAGVRPVLVDRTGTFGNGYVRVSDLRGLYDFFE